MSQRVKYYPFYIAGVKQVYPNVHPGTPKYASAVVVDNLVFLSGMTAQDTKTGACLTDTIADQMIVCLDKVKAGLEEVGSSMENIIKTLILLKDVKDYQIMRKTELEYYQKHAPRLVDEPPASTFMQPAALARPEFLVELDVIAVVSRE
ncbi:MAG TPA: RidA family protein [Desulfatiglandales bacterium]|nr:RidA family protein [Desulfatiglandales bacterium]